MLGKDIHSQRLHGSILRPKADAAEQAPDKRDHRPPHRRHEQARRRKAEKGIQKHLPAPFAYPAGEILGRSMPQLMSEMQMAAPEGELSSVEKNGFAK